ncbi:10942_t:CDS:2, partial [Funneliformis caledonium]
MSYKTTKSKKDIWYQVVRREVNYVEQPVGGRTLILEAKKANENEYTTLNSTFFLNQYDSDFNKLVATENEEVQRLRNKIQEMDSEMKRMSIHSVQAEAPSNEIHVHEIKCRLKNTVENVYENVVTLHRGESEVLNSDISIDGLYNMENNALQVIVESSTLNITLSSSDVMDIRSEMYKENLRKHYVPYITIFQSSGYGKSQLVKEMARRIPTIYLCLQDTNSTGYPSRTRVGAELFERELKELREGEEWRFTYILQNNQMDTNYYTVIWTEISRRSSSWRNIIDSELDMSASFITNDNSNNNVCFLLCIDEARTLISPINKHKFSPFRLFRKALKNVRWHGFFALLLDTLSRISNFAPSKSIDPSHCDNENDECRNLAKYGRPLYMSYLQSNIDDPQVIHKFINLLKRKLLGGTNNFENSRK